MAPHVGLLRAVLWACVITSFTGSVLGIRIGDIELFAFRIITLIAFPLMILFPPRQRPGLSRSSSRFMAAMLIYAAFSLVWSPDRALGVRALGILFSGITIFILVNRFGSDRRTIFKILVIWSIAVIAIDSLGIYEIIRGSYLFTSPLDSHVNQVRQLRKVTNELGWLCPRVFYTNWNDLAFVNGLSALVLTGWGLETSGLRRGLALTAAGLAVLLAFLSYSRASTLGMGIGLVVFVVTSWKRSKGKWTKRISLTVFVMLLFSILIVPAIHYIFKIRLADVILSKWTMFGMGERVYLYSTAIHQGTLGSWGFGKGLGASSLLIIEGSYHHFWLEIFAELGLFFFLGHCIILTVVCRKLYAQIGRERYRYLATGMLASCVAFPVLAAGPSSLLGMAPYWLWFALVIVFADNLEPTQSRNKSVYHNRHLGHRTFGRERVQSNTAQSVSLPLQDLSNIFMTERE